MLLSINKAYSYKDYLNILDDILMVNVIMGIDGPSGASDMNMDGVKNVLDVILLVNVILEA